jgi:hypothetical protein
MANSREGLEMIADRQGLDPVLPGGRCDRGSVAQIAR